MSSKKFRAYYSTKVLAPWMLAFGLAGGVPAQEFSPANTLLFDTDHLAEISPPVTLHYDFRRTGGPEEDFSDEINVRVIGKQVDGAKQVELEYFTGPRQRYVPSLSGVRGNPVIMLFLQHDVQEMERLAGGSWRYYQKRIKQALEEAANLDTVTVTMDGQDVEAERVRVEPFTKDPNRERFTEYADKSYEFILAKGVPGQVYQIKSLVENPQDGPGLEETLTFREITR